MAALLQALAATGTCLTLDELEMATGCSYREICRELRHTYKAGWVERADQGCYRLTPIGRDASANGTPLPVEIRGNSGRPGRSDTQRGRMWAAMCSLRKFCRADVIELAAGPHDDRARMDRTLSFYLGRLHCAGYVIRLPGTVRVNRDARGQARWRLTWNTGPQVPRPVPGPGQFVYDANRDRTFSPANPVGPI